MMLRTSLQAAVVTLLAVFALVFAIYAIEPFGNFVLSDATGRDHSPVAQ